MRDAALSSILMVLLVAGRAGAQEAGAPPVAATFAWSSIEVANLPLDAEREAYLLDTVVTVAEGTTGPLAGLAGRCLVSGVRDAASGRHEASGRCALTDGPADRLLLVLAEGSEGGAALTMGRGAWEGGTGRFEGVAGEFAYRLVSYGLRPPGTLEGTGSLEGTWLGGRGAQDGPEAPPAGGLELRPAAPRRRRGSSAASGPVRAALPRVA